MSGICTTVLASPDPAKLGKSVTFGPEPRGRARDGRGSRRVRRRVAAGAIARAACRRAHRPRPAERPDGPEWMPPRLRILLSGSTRLQTREGFGEPMKHVRDRAGERESF